MKNLGLFKRIKITLITIIGYLIIRGLRLTVRIRVLHHERLARFLDSGQHVIYCFWHDRLLFMPFIALKQRAVVLISRHMDGEYISRVIAFFGFRSVRGSSTRGGSLALRKMARIMRAGSHGAITPDGPKGPRHKAKEGAIMLASLTGAPLIPIAFNSSKKKTYQAGTGFLSPFHSQGVCL